VNRLKRENRRERKREKEREREREREREYKLGIGIVFVQFINLKFIVHSAFDHLMLSGVIQMTDGTTGIGKDDALRGNITIQHLKI